LKNKSKILLTHPISYQISLLVEVINCKLLIKMWWIKSIHYSQSATKTYCKIGCFTRFIQNKCSYVKSL